MSETNIDAVASLWPAAMPFAVASLWSAAVVYFMSIERPTPEHQTVVVLGIPGGAAVAIVPGTSFGADFIVVAIGEHAAELSSPRGTVKGSVGGAGAGGCQCRRTTSTSARSVSAATAMATTVPASPLTAK